MTLVLAVILAVVDLSVSYERVGDVLVAQGNLPEALKAFRDSLAIRDRLGKPQ